MASCGDVKDEPSYFQAIDFDLVTIAALSKDTLHVAQVVPSTRLADSTAIAFLLSLNLRTAFWKPQACRPIPARKEINRSQSL